MNTTMAPLNYIQQGKLGEHQRAHASQHEISVIRKMDETGCSGRNKRGLGNNGHNNNKRNRNGNNSNSKTKISNNGGSSNGKRGFNDGSNKRRLNFSPLFFDKRKSSSSAAAIRRTFAPPASTALLETATFISTPRSSSARGASLIADSSSTSSASSIPIITASNKSTSSQITTIARSIIGSGQSRNIIVTLSPLAIITKVTATRSSIPKVETIILAPSTRNVGDPFALGTVNKNSEEMSPLAEQLLIVAGAIGAFILVVAVIFFVFRANKKHLFLPYHKTKAREKGAHGWYGKRRGSRGPNPNGPPRGTGVQEGNGYSTDEKSLPSKPNFDAFSSKAMSTLATPASAAALSRGDSRSQDLVRAAFQGNQVDFGSASGPRAVIRSDTETFYTTRNQIAPLSRQPSQTPGTETINLSTRFSGSYKTTGTLTRQPSNLYKNTGTQNTFLARNTSDAYDPNPRETNRMSYLSSLSSGFGDGLIIPETGLSNSIAGRQSYGQSRNQRASRFSWATSGPRTPGLKGDRASMYTIASVESAPRFRTVNSWVAQQSGRVERRQRSDEEIPSMPTIPIPLQTVIGLRRHQSENSAFRHHPGEKIQISPGSRVPSSILDSKLGGK